MQKGGETQRETVEEMVGGETSVNVSQCLLSAESIVINHMFINY